MAGVVSSSSHGDTGEVRKSLGLIKVGEADNADANADAAASSFADIGIATVGLSSRAEVCSEDLFEANIVK
jgi:hypothetical protein